MFIVLVESNILDGQLKFVRTCAQANRSNVLCR
jgi:hypothetical protein